MNSVTLSVHAEKFPNFQKVLVPSWLMFEKIGKVAFTALVLVGALVLIGVGLLAAGIGFHLPVVTIAGGAVLTFTLAYFGTDIIQYLFGKILPEQNRTPAA